MSENNEDLEKNKNDKKIKNESFISRLSKGFLNIKGEFSRIIWPSRKVLFRQTTNVIITSILIGSLIVALDFVYSAGFNGVVNLISN